MSNTTVMYPIVGATSKAAEFLEIKNEWVGVNEKQLQYLIEHHHICKDEIKNIPDMETIASASADEINKFLKDRGFDIQLDPFSGKDEFGTASVLDVLVEWIKEGKKISINTKDDAEYPGVYIKNCEIFTSNKHSNPIIRLKTKSDDIVYLTIDKEYSEFELVNRVEKLSNTLKFTNDYEGAEFPMVSLDQEVDISWLKLMKIYKDDQPWYIVQALQQTKFRMNHQGARAESAVTMAFDCCGRSMPKPRVVIDRPFLIWIERPGLQKPLFVGYITEDDWKDPKGLE